MSTQTEIDRARESRIDIPICVAVFTLIVATTAVSARIYTRKWLLNQFGIDDGFAVTALVRTASKCNSDEEMANMIAAPRLRMRLCRYL